MADDYFNDEDYPLLDDRSLAEMMAELNHSRHAHSNAPTAEYGVQLVYGEAGTPSSSVAEVRSNYVTDTSDETSILGIAARRKRGGSIRARKGSPLFHVPPDAGPDITLGLLRTIYYNPDRQITSIQELCALAMAMYKVGQHYFDATQLARLTNLIDYKGQGQPITLTLLGQSIVQTTREMQVDILHYLLYTGWDERQPQRRGPLWTYRQVCDLLWQDGETRVKHTELALTVRHDIEREFAAVTGFWPAGLSFSAKSVRGVTIWLERLQPPALMAGVFRVRQHCSPELLRLAIAASGATYPRQVTTSPASSARRSANSAYSTPTL